MSGVVKIDITESPEFLNILLSQQKTATGKERVQALYLLSTKQVETVQHLTVVLGRNRVTVQRWLSRFAMIYWLAASEVGSASLILVHTAVPIGVSLCGVHPILAHSPSLLLPITEWLGEIPTFSIMKNASNPNSSSPVKRRNRMSNR